MFNVKEIQQHLWDVFILIDYLLTRQMTETSFFKNKYYSGEGRELHTWVKPLKAVEQMDSHETFVTFWSGSNLQLPAAQIQNPSRFAFFCPALTGALVFSSWFCLNYITRYSWGETALRASVGIFLTLLGQSFLLFIYLVMLIKLHDVVPHP